MQRHSFGLFGLVAATWALAGPTLAAVKAEVDYQTDVVYGTAKGEKLILDIAAPKGLDHEVPGLVIIHGGGWAGGDKKDFADISRQFAAAGYVAVNINYRHAPKFVFPAQVEDAKCAVRWLRSNAKKLHVNPEKIGALGGSAGAHLSMMLGTMDPSDGLEGDGGQPKEPSKVQAVVSYVGPTNLATEYPPASKAIVAGFIGGTQEEKKDAYRQASPITYVNAGDAPMLIYQGTKDPLVLNDQAVQMAQALTDAGVAGRVELILGAGHGWNGREMERTMRDSLAFFDLYLKK